MTAGRGETMRGNGRKDTWRTAEPVGLAAVMVLVLAVSYWNQRLETRVKKTRVAKAQVVELRKAVWLYHFDMGSFPGGADGLEALVRSPGDPSWRGPYLESKRLPRDPWGREYIYRDPDSGDSGARIHSAGPDRKDGTADDIGISLGEPGRRTERRGSLLAGGETMPAQRA